MNRNEGKDAARIVRRATFFSGLLSGLIFCGLAAPLAAAAEPFTISGVTEPYRDVPLGISVPGRIARIDATEGARVAKGEVILALDLQLETLEVERRKLIWQSKVEVESAALQVKTLEEHLAATRDLYQSSGSVNREELENQELEVALAKAELARLENAEKREEVEYNIAREQLDKRTLRAPFSGAIAELLVGVGENCDLDKPLVQLVDTRRGYFVANVELATIENLKLGQAVELQLQAGSEPVKLDGEIVFISPVVDPASGLRKVKALFANKDGEVVPGVAGLMLLAPR